MDPKYRKKLEEQSYVFAGDTTAVKICGWTKKSLREEGTCYKETFYGIRAHRCVQMSPAVNFCDHDCVFCWRDRNNSGFGKIDDPIKIIDTCIDAQRKLITGFGGNPKTNMNKFKEAQDPVHFAISLNGEVTYYPKLSEFITELKKRKLSSFVVTNGQLPNVLEKMEAPTQLYLSLDGCNKELYERVDRPMRKDGWERILKSLDVLKARKNETKTTIRITHVHNINNVNPEEWANLITRADPHFVEVKAFMLLGSSRERLTLDNMPYHEQVKEFAEEICKYCDYEIVDEHLKSRVVLLMKPEEKNAEWRYLNNPTTDQEYRRGDSKPLPKFDDQACDELNIEDADKLVKQELIKIN